jgi:hypothetical protein
MPDAARLNLADDGCTGVHLSFLQGLEPDVGKLPIGVERIGVWQPKSHEVIELQEAAQQIP